MRHKNLATTWSQNLYEILTSPHWKLSTDALDGKEKCFYYQNDIFHLWKRMQHLAYKCKHTIHNKESLSSCYSHGIICHACVRSSITQLHLSILKLWTPVPNNKLSRITPKYDFENFFAIILSRRQVTLTWRDQDKC